MLPADSADHGAILTIDLAAIAANWRLMAAMVAPAGCGAVVKADAYGLGIEAVVPALVAAGCSSFFVAHLSEAERVLPLARDAAIHVLNGLPPGAEGRYLRAGLRPVLGSHEDWRRWSAAAGPGAPPATLHVDTGMNRLGLRPDELRALLAAPAPFPVGLLMSHFVAAEEPDDPVTARQITAFAALGDLLPGVPRSLANSAGTFRAERPFFDLVRPGYALYGGNPAPGQPNPLRPVVRLEAPVVQVRDVPAGETVGYNGLWRAARPSRIAVLSIGYADGFFRTSPRRTAAAPRVARLGGALCPFIGSVSMDLIAVDATDAPDAVEPGGRALLIGDETLTIDAVGEAAGTIGYEVLTNLGRRYRRRYIGG